MDDDKTLEQVAEAAVDSPDEITVDVQPTGRVHALAQRLGLAERKKTFTLEPLYYGTLIRISRLLLSIELKAPESRDAAAGWLDANYKAIEAHGETMAQILALAVRNRNADPDKRLVRFILANFTAREMMAVLAIVIRRLDLTSFMSSIVSIRGLNVLEARNVPAGSAKVKEASL